LHEAPPLVALGAVDGPATYAELPVVVPAGMDLTPAQRDQLASQDAPVHHKELILPLGDLLPAVPEEPR